MNVRFFYRTLWVGMEKIYTAFIKLFMLHVRNVRPVLEYKRPMLFIHPIRDREILVKMKKKRCRKHFQERLDSCNKYKNIKKTEFRSLQAHEMLAPVGALFAPLTKDLAFKNRVTQNCLPSKQATQ